jgi:phosphoglycerol transferase
MKISTAGKWAFSVPFIAMFWAIARVWPVLPAVMQDEYIYSTQSRFTPFAEQQFPNYIYSWLYSTTSVCGDNFYQCAKGFNSVFFLITLVFIYLIAARIVGHAWAIVVATVSAVSPIHAYVAYFMPESMYMAFMFATIWVTLNAVRDGHWQRWLIAGSMLGLTALVKPHAFFALPAFLLVALIVSAREEGHSFKRISLKVLSFAAAFFVVKFAIGFAFAGARGLSIFGGYGGVDALVNQIASGAEAVNQSQAKSFGEVFFSVTALQIPSHVSILLLIAGLPLLLSVRVLFSSIKSKSPISELGSFVVLVGIISFSFALVVAVFEGYVSAGGDDHSDRIIMRYYEFIIPLLLILGLSFEKYVASKTLSRLLQAVVVIAASTFVLIYFPSNIESQFADSGLLVGILQTPGALITIFIFEVIGALLWVMKPEISEKWLGRALLPIMILIMGMVSQSALMTQVGTQKAFFDVAGQDSRDYLRDVDGKDIVIIGPMRTQVFVAKFWIDKAKIEDRLIPEKQVIEMEEVPNAKYALLLAGTGVAGEHQVITQGDGYALVKLRD